MSPQAANLPLVLSRILSVLPVQPLRAGFPDVESATRYLLTHAENLVEDKVYPRLPIEPYLDAMVEVLSFIHEYPERFAEANLGKEVCLAAEYIAIEIQTLPNVSLHVVPEEKMANQDLLSTAAVLLCAYQDAIRRVARGSSAAPVRAAFGLQTEVDSKDVDQILKGIGRFLSAAAQHPDYTIEAGISFGQLKGLEAQRRVLQQWVKKCQAGGIPQASTLKRAKVLHAAIEYFFDRFAAAMSAKFLDMPEERVRGLRLVPRNR